MLLAMYEVAWRFAALPRFLMGNLVLRVGADAAQLGRADSNEMRALLRGATLISGIAGLVSCVPVCAAYWLFQRFTDEQPNWAVFLGMLVVFTLLGTTAPVSLSGAAVGNAWIDIPYALGALVASSAFAVIAGLLSYPGIFIAGYLASIAVAVFCYFMYAPGLVRRGLASRHVDRPTESKEKLG